MKKNWVIIVLILTILFLTTACSFLGSTKSEQVNTAREAKKPVVQATIYPIYYLTERIAGVDFEVQSFIPMGVEPHGWEPKPSDLVKIEETDLFIYNGAGFEHWIVDIIDSANNPNLIIVNATEGIELIKNSNGSILDNPHCWLDPLKAQAMAENIKKVLISNYPNHQSSLEKNYEELFNDLEQLHLNYQRVLENTSKKEIIVTHDAFGYLAQRYKLKQIPIMGGDAHTEPTPRKMATIVQMAKELGLNYIFAEEMISTKVVQTLADEANLTIETLNPLGNLSPQNIENNDDYLTIMYKNLEVLEKALK